MSKIIIERQRVLLQLLDKKNTKWTQQQLIDALASKDEILRCSKSTISRDLEELEYAYVDGTYIKIKKKFKISEEMKILKSLLEYKYPMFIGSEGMDYMILYIKDGLQEIIRNLISEIFHDKYIGIFDGKDCILILSDTTSLNFIKAALQKVIDPF